MLSVRRKPGTAGEGIRHVEAGIRSLLRSDHREQRPRRDDRPVGGCYRARAYDAPMGARLLGLLTAVFADTSHRHRGLQWLVADEAVIISAIVTIIGPRGLSISVDRGSDMANGRSSPFGSTLKRKGSTEVHDLRMMTVCSMRLSLIALCDFSSLGPVVGTYRGDKQRGETRTTRRSHLPTSTRRGSFRYRVDDIGNSSAAVRNIVIERRNR